MTSISKETLRLVARYFAKRSNNMTPKESRTHTTTNELIKRYFAPAKTSNGECCQNGVVGKLRPESP